MTTADFGQLQSALTRPDLLVTDVDAYEAYHHDATDDHGRPGAIVFAETENDVIACIRYCSQHGLPVVGRGAGTGLSGGAVPSDGAIVLSTERMTEMVIDPETTTAICGPGVITEHLQDRAAELGLAYPPDPASFKESTLGGNIAENAGGLRCKRFGVTKDYVIGLQAVLADGTILRTGTLAQNRGFCLGDVLIGSEGTLGIITRIMLRLIPATRHGATILAAFDKPENAAQTVSDITGAGLIPTVMEYVDGDAAAAANEYKQVKGIDRAAAVLLLETTEKDPVTETTQIRRFCETNHASCVRIESNPARAEELWDVRRNISTALKEMAAIRISEDVAVPNNQFPVLVAFVDQMNTDSSIRINSYGHAGDGNLHVNFISMTGSTADKTEIYRRIEQLMRRTIELGGTLSGEHGIGLAKRKYIGLEFNEPTRDYMLRVKEAFDPKDILNPGKIFEK